MECSKTKRFTKKTEHIIETSRSLFFRYGISRVSVDEICRKSGISKMTFYRHFNNRTDLALYILKELYDEIRSKMNSVLDDDIPFQEKIKKAFIIKKDYMKKFSNEFTKEIISGTDQILKSFIEEENKKSLQKMEKVFREAQKKGEIRREIKIEFLIYMLNKIMEIFKDEQLLGVYKDVLEINEEVLNFFYYGIIKYK